MVLVILQARMSSKRLPGKVMMEVLGEPILKFQIERIKKAKLVDKIVLATSVNIEDDPLFELANLCGIDCFRGDLNNVLDRFYSCATQYQASNIVRITGDCPLIDPVVIDEVIRAHLSSESDFSSNVIDRTFPDGLDTEVMTYQVLDRLHHIAASREELEHVTYYAYRHLDEFKVASITNSTDTSDLRWTLDTKEDFDFLKQKIEQIKNVNFLWKDLL